MLKGPLEELRLCSGNEDCQLHIDSQITILNILRSEWFCLQCLFLKFWCIQHWSVISLLLILSIFCIILVLFTFDLIYFLFRLACFKTFLLVWNDKQHLRCFSLSCSLLNFLKPVQIISCVVTNLFLFFISAVSILVKEML